MWLLDVNMPNNLTLLLRELGVDAETARSRAWDTLQFVEVFRSAWDKAPVVPVPGHMIVWPL